MSSSLPTPRSLADVIGALEARADLGGTRRRDLLSTIRRIAELLQTTPEHLPASIAGLRPRLNEVAPAAHGVAAKTWYNLRSNLLAAIRLAAPPAPVQVLPSLGWARLRRMLPDKRMQNGLTRFLTFCEREGLEPEQIDDGVADRFAQELISGTLVAAPQDLHRRTCRLWNEATALPGWPQTRLAVPDYRKPRTSLTVADLPSSFGDDLSHHLAWLAGSDPFVERPPPTACKPRTIELRRRLMLLAASALVARGRAPGQIRGLADLVEPAGFKDILRHYVDKNGKEIRVFVRNIATALIAVATHWVRVPPETLTELKSLRRRLGTTPSGLTDKNREMLRRLSDPAVRRRLLDLPRQLIAEARSGRLDPGRAATRYQLGLAIEILLHAPMRMNNLVGLQLGGDLIRQEGRHGLWHVVLTRNAVKNGDALEYELSAEPSRLVDIYLRDLRPALAPGEVCFLFVAAGGRAKRQATLSKQLQEIIAARVGIPMTPHQFRHFAAKLALEANPGALAFAGQLLGHRSLKTTTAFYSGIDSMTAGRHFDRIIAEERAKAPPARCRTRRRIDRASTPSALQGDRDLAP